MTIKILKGRLTSLLVFAWIFVNNANASLITETYNFKVDSITGTGQYLANNVGDIVSLSLPMMILHIKCI
ncbi:MAG: hypothetical protein ACI9LM_002961 [Alteromonadaceae bacterium]|jgi:hypothetical protein